MLCPALHALASCAIAPWLHELRRNCSAWATELMQHDVDRTAIGHEVGGSSSDAAFDAACLADANHQLRGRKKAASKRSIVRNTPLGVLKKTRSTPKIEDYHNARTMILISQAAVEKLPRNSAYARHRKACLGKALMLLDSQRSGMCSTACLAYHPHAWSLQSALY